MEKRVAPPPPPPSFKEGINESLDDICNDIGTPFRRKLTRIIAENKIKLIAIIEKIENTRLEVRRIDNQKSITADLRRKRGEPNKTAYRS
jgi:hypothetical protein